MVEVDPRNPRAAALFEGLRAHLDLESLDPSLCLVVGGDGWMLSVMYRLGSGYTYLGLNAGTLGFLLNEAHDPAVVAAELRAEAWQSHAFPRLQMLAVNTHGDEIESLAVNDLYLERSTGQTAHLRLTLDSVVVVERLVCDGLLVATALGSTAYSFSAGGIPCHPLVAATQVTPICPHLPRLSPMVLPLDTHIRVEAVSTDRRPVRAICDGVDRGPVVEMRIRRAKEDVKLAFLEGHHFTETLVKKILQS